MKRNLRVLMAAIAAVVSGILCYTEDPLTNNQPLNKWQVAFVIVSMFILTLRVLKLVNDEIRRDAMSRRTVNKPY